MRKTVYGKKAARSAFVVSTIFTESSPAKPVSRPTFKDEPSDPLAQVVTQLEKLDIQDGDSDALPVKRQRRPLSRRDGNSRPTSKHGEEKEKKLCSKSKTQCYIPPQETSEPRVNTRYVQESPEEQMSHASQAASSIFELCDEYIQPLVELTNEQRIPLAFEAWSDALIPHFSISKIAEASYSEVYRLSLLEYHPTLTTADESVLKLVAIKPPSTTSQHKRTKAQVKREDDMSSVGDVVSEVRLLKRMTEVPGFTNYRALHLLQGRPSKPFVQAWKEWNKTRRKGDKSEFPDPSRKANYDENQYWAVIEMQDAGTDVEKLIEDEVKSKVSSVEDEDSVRSIWATWDIFWQTVLAVAKGESEARFEHRDLHLGNICVRRKDVKSSSALADDFLDRKLSFTSLEATLIDYTLSRAELSTSRLVRPQSSHSSSSSVSAGTSSEVEDVEVEIAYNPLQKQPKVFEGDAEVEYQYEIYRYMRTIVEAHPAEDADHWRRYQPKTNLLWLHFVLFKMCETLHWPSEHSPKRKGPKQKKALVLESILVQVEDLLTIKRLVGEKENVLASAAELVAVALEQGWLDQEDINA